MTKALINFGIAAAYAPLGSCFLPKTLKYLSPISSRSYREENTPAYNSFTYFVTAYGDNGRPISSSTFGSFFESP